MIKRVSLVRRKAELSREAFFEHWMGAHAQIVRKLPRLRGLRFEVVEQWSPDGAAWDGVGELWFDSVADAELAFLSEPLASMLAEDRKRIFGETQWCFVREHTVIPPPPDSCSTSATRENI
jgi:uncharacterized protein (TIGR02118 family)